MSDLLTVDDRGAVRWLTIERAETRNAIPYDGWDELTAAFRDFESSAARVLVIRGRGEDFCSGAEVSSLDDTDGVVMAAAAMARTGAAAVALHRLSKPTIAAVDGVAAGAGMNLAIGCDVVIATDRARFSEIFVKRGVSLDFGGSWLLPRLVGMAKAKELALTGRIVDAAEALQIGLVSRVVPVDRLDDVVTGAAEAMAAGAPLAQRFVKIVLDRAPSLTFEQAIELEAQAQSLLLRSEDLREAVAAFEEKREPRFEGR